MRFYKLFRWTAETTVLDIGGNFFIWQLIREMGLPVPKLTFVNLSIEVMGLPADSPVHVVQGSGIYLPFRDRSFDIAFCNSVIEHLFVLNNQILFAKEVERVGRAYFVQTPDPAFFIEPHYITPFVHWFPTTIRARMIRNFTLYGWITRPTVEEAKQMALEIQLIPKSSFQKMFCRGELIQERLAGWPKALIMCVRPNIFEQSK